MLARSSSIDSPWLAQPGMAGTSAQKPPSSASCTITLIFMRRPFDAGQFTPAQPVFKAALSRSIPKHPSRDPPVPPIAAVLRKRLLVPELVGRRPVGQLQQQRRPDVVRAIRRADRAAEDEAVGI